MAPWDMIPTGLAPLHHADVHHHLHPHPLRHAVKPHPQHVKF